MSFWSRLFGDTPPTDPNYHPGDPDGVEVVGDELVGERSLPMVFPSPWSGWPGEWSTPLFNAGAGFNKLVDVAWAAIDLNASVLSAMPVYRLASGEIVDNLGWMENPDPSIYSSWQEFAKQLFWDYQMAGEAFVLPMSHYANGYPQNFRVVPGWLIEAEMRGGTRRYRLGATDVTDEILHIRYQSATDDAHGHSPLEVAGARMLSSQLLTRYTHRLAETGGTPHYWINVDRHLNKEQADDLLDQWVESRKRRAGEPALLTGGASLNQLQSMDARNMALLELQQFNEARVAVVLGVPPFLLGLPMATGESLTYCLSDDTEILTRRGWLTCDEITIDDVALTLDHEHGVTTWQPVTAVNIFDVVDEPMLRMDSRAHSSLSTMGHRWPTITRSGGKRRWIHSKDFSQEDNIVLAAPCAELPTEPKYSDEFVELVAWFTTEGYVNTDNSRVYSTIAQSSSRNVDNVSAIRLTLTKIFGPARPKGQKRTSYERIFGCEPAWVEDRFPHNGMIVFRLNHEATMLLLAITHGKPQMKAVNFDFLLSLTLAQLHLFIDTCIAGDGTAYAGRGNQRVFIQKRCPRIDSFRFACTLAGISTSIYPRTGSDCVCIGVKKRATYNPTFHNPSPPEKVTWTGRVWCPTTSNGTWYARRNDREFFTGNSNASTLFDFHDRSSLRPKAGAVMAALSYWALPRGQSVELNRDEYSRPGYLERAQANQIYMQTGVLDADDVRAAERFHGQAAAAALTGGQPPTAAAPATAPPPPPLTASPVPQSQNGKAPT